MMYLKELVIKIQDLRKSPRHGSPETGSWLETDPDGDHIDYYELEDLIKKMIGEQERDELMQTYADLGEDN